MFPRTILALLALALTFCARAATAPFPAIYNSETSTNKLVPPAEAAALFQLPPGFKATLFAGEPDVQNPIAIAFDEKGRLWVVENYTYAETKINFDLTLRDRIVVFEDTNHDGKFDKRTVFADNLQRATSIEIGDGGVYVLAAPQLLFIADKNGDLVPDGEPQVLLDGWDAGPVRHNIVNGLRWGPDGWLYGRHGIMATSYVGAPGMTKAQRTALNACIWRYHPYTHKFEVVTWGTTNSWGNDWDENGELWFINTVIGHLWHGIPGAHMKRMYGEDLNPHTYELIDQHADHYHWDTGKAWTDSRNAAGKSDALGGGHAHTGLMFYQGDNWPNRYRNSLYTINLHGHRLNNDRLERAGSGYVGKHLPDLFQTTDPWFRAIDIVQGPQGAVYMADWSDVGECHDNDGVHRTSGRIYRFTYGEPKPPKVEDLATLSDDKLVELVTQPDEWLSRTARRLLAQRAHSGRQEIGNRVLHNLLRKVYANANVPVRKERALWALHATGGTTEAWLLDQLTAKNENVRSWIVRLLSDQAPPSTAAIDRLVTLAENEESGLVRLYLASTLQKLPLTERPRLARPLLAHADDAADHNQPLLLWYGIEPALAQTPDVAQELFHVTAMPKVRKLIVRRVSEFYDQNPGPLAALLTGVTQAISSNRALDVVEGLSEATRGWRKTKAPDGWSAFSASFANASDSRLQDQLRQLGVLFGDGRSLETLKTIALDDQADGNSRRKALRVLLDNVTPDFAPLLQTLISNKITAPMAAEGLVRLDTPGTAALLVGRYNQFLPEDRPQVIALLTSRAPYASELLDGLEAGRVPRRDVNVFQARQIRSLGKPELDAKLEKAWGQLRNSDADKRKRVTEYRAQLTGKALAAADTKKGQALFQQVCAVCHKLRGEGASIGPDLTGSGRSNLDYLLENIIDPSAVVAADFRMSVVNLKDGTTYNGILGPQTGKTLSVQTPASLVTVQRSDVEKVETSNVSLMPEGLFDALSPEQRADLIAFLMAP